MAGNTSDRRHFFALVVNFWTPLKAKRIAAASPVIRPNIVRFLCFLLIIFLLFLCGRQPQMLEMLHSSRHYVLEEVAEEAPHRHARELHRAHHAQIDRGHLRALVTAVVLDHFPQCRERSHLTFRKVVVYLVSSVLAIEKKGIRTIIYCLSFSRQTSSARYWSLRQCRSATPSCIKRNTSEP